MDNPKDTNAAVWQTECAFLTAGARYSEFESGVLAVNQWSGQLPDARVFWWKKPQVALPAEILASAQPTRIVSPSPLEGALRDGARVESRIAMHLPLKDSPASPSNEIELIPIRSEAQWGEYLEARVLIEAANHGHPSERAKQSVARMRNRESLLEGCWYSTRVDSEFVGAIGIWYFDTPAGRLARLKNVDILPAHRGRGYGDGMLAAAYAMARDAGADALCLRAVPDDWPREWYARRGFVEVGTWSRFWVGK